MKAPDAVIQELLLKVRRDLYPGETYDTWAAQQKMVQKALHHPAVYLNKMGVELPAERYQAIVSAIIETIRDNGNLSNVGYMARYFYTCVQRHMDHHGDEYYSEGKSVNNRVSLVMNALERAQRGADGTIPILAEADKLLQLGKRQPKVKASPVKPNQPDLFL